MVSPNVRRKLKFWVYLGRLMVFNKILHLQSVLSLLFKEGEITQDFLWTNISPFRDLPLELPEISTGSTWDLPQIDTEDFPSCHPLAFYSLFKEKHFSATILPLSLKAFRFLLKKNHVSQRSLVVHRSTCKSDIIGPFGNEILGKCYRPCQPKNKI